MNGEPALGVDLLGDVAVIFGAADSMFGREQRDELHARFRRARVLAKEVDIRAAFFILAGLIRDERDAAVLNDADALL